MTFKVRAKPCANCLYSKDKIVSDERRDELIEGLSRKDAHFICHKNEDVCCYGFYKRNTTNLIRIAQRLGAVEMVDGETR